MLLGGIQAEKTMFEKHPACIMLIAVTFAKSLPSHEQLRIKAPVKWDREGERKGN